MAEKIAPGAWHEGPGGPGGPGSPGGPGGPGGEPGPALSAKDAEVERLTGKRDNARWSAVVGFAMLFGGYFSAGFVVGGILMIAYGGTSSFYWSRRLAKVKGDPWKYDPELDGPHAPDWAKR